MIIVPQLIVHGMKNNSTVGPFGKLSSTSVPVHSGGRTSKHDFVQCTKEPEVLSRVPVARAVLVESTET